MKKYPAHQMSEVSQVNLPKQNSSAKLETLGGAKDAC
jgi:hypothetical protein